jgi:hypothetical protein
MRLKVSNKYWKIKLFTPEEFADKLGSSGENAAALTDLDKRTVYFITTELTEGHVRHELFHVYFSLSFVNSANLDMNQTEEVAAEIMAMYGEEYIANSRKVFAWLQKQLTEITK